MTYPKYPYKHSYTPWCKCVHLRKWCFNWWIYVGERHIYEGVRIFGHKWERIIPLTKHGGLAWKQGNELSCE